MLVTDVDVTGGCATVEMIRQAGGSAEFIALDVADEAQLEAAVDHAVHTFGRLDGAFNNAGMPESFTSMLDGTEETFDRLIAINVKAVWRFMRVQIRQMWRQGGGGSIVNTASTAGLRGSSLMPIYSATKHAVVGLSRSAAIEFATAGPRVNAVCPGVVDTPMMQRVAAGERARSAFLAAQPNGRFGRPEEIGEAAASLLSDAASFVTGVAMSVDGGMTS